jgi:hypothetical protein
MRTKNLKASQWQEASDNESDFDLSEGSSERDIKPQSSESGVHSLV